MESKKVSKTHIASPEMNYNTTKTDEVKKDLHEAHTQTITKQNGLVTKSISHTTTMIGVSKKCANCGKRIGTDEYITG